MRRLNGTWEPEIPMLTEKPQVEDPRGREYGCGFSGADCPVVVTKRGNARGAKGTGRSRHNRCGQPATGGTARLLRREHQLSLNGKSRVSREAQARFREGLGVKSPGATRPSIGSGNRSYVEEIPTFLSCTAKINHGLRFIRLGH